MGPAFHRIGHCLALPPRAGGHFIAQQGLPPLCRQAGQYWRRVRAQPSLVVRTRGEYAGRGVRCLKRLGRVLPVSQRHDLPPCCSWLAGLHSPVTCWIPAHPHVPRLFVPSSAACASHMSAGDSKIRGMKVLVTVPASARAERLGCIGAVTRRCLLASICCLARAIQHQP